MYLRKSLAPLFIAICALTCGQGTETANDQNNQEKAGSPHVISSMLVSTEWLNKNLDAENLVILHVATGRETYDSGHIPGALYLGWEQFTGTVEGLANELPPLDSLAALFGSLGIDGSRRIVIYDDENGIRAARAYFTLDYLGLGDSSALLDGQLSVWKAEGRPLSTEIPVTQARNFQPTLNPGILVSMEELQEMISDGESSLADCRPPDQFSGEVPGREIDRGGHIPGAYNLPAVRTLVSQEQPLFLAIDKLRVLYTQAGFATDQPVVTYCRTGRSASLGYFVLKYLGYDARLYDGSFSQWQSVENNPVESGE